jgi:hypothetical protein
LASPLLLALFLGPNASITFEAAAQVLLGACPLQDVETLPQSSRPRLIVSVLLELFCEFSDLP